MKAIGLGHLRTTEEGKKIVFRVSAEERVWPLQICTSIMALFLQVNFKITGLFAQWTEHYESNKNEG